MEPFEAISLAETVLRDLIREVVGNEWQSAPDIDLAKLEATRDTELGRRRGARVSDDLLDFTEFIQLRSIVDYKWEKFKPVLKSSKIFNVYMDRLGTYRNPTMHTRPLLVHEVNLVQGIVGEIRNLITLYRSDQGPDMNYYPVITKVTDITHGIELGQGTKTGLILRPGDVVRFRCFGTDPQDRLLLWKLMPTGPTLTFYVIDTGEGNEVEMTWTVTDNNVGECRFVAVEMSSDGQYHREGDCDARLGFYYRVDPPLAEATT